MHYRSKVNICHEETKTKAPLCLRGPKGCLYVVAERKFLYLKGIEPAFSSPHPATLLSYHVLYMPVIWRKVGQLIYEITLDNRGSIPGRRRHVKFAWLRAIKTPVIRTTDITMHTAYSCGTQCIM
jgi:hypothetical protein